MTVTSESPEVAELPSPQLGSQPSRVMAALGRAVRALDARIDRLGILLAVLFAVPTLAYPFGRDQALFYYIGREWAAGRLPYLDAFDVKPPGIYLVYAIATALFGERMWAIRLVEIAAMVPLTWMIVRTVRRSEPARRGEWGAVAVLFAAWYFTVFDYWDCGQVEFWEGLFLLAGVLAAYSGRRWRVAAFVAGVLGATATLFKPPALLVVPVAAGIVVVRAWRSRSGEADDTTARRVGRATEALAIHLAGAVLTVGAVVAYFASRGGLHALGDLVGYSIYYFHHKTSEVDGKEWLKAFWIGHAQPLVKYELALAGIGLVVAAARRAWKELAGAAVALLLIALAFATVVLQNKFWPYHWGVVSPFLIYAAAYGIAQIARSFRPAVLPVALAIATLAFVKAEPWFANSHTTYRTYVASFWDYLRGRTSRAAFLDQFRGPFDYRYADQEQLGDLLASMAHPGDELQVRGFEPAIYAVSRLSSPTRFASEAPLIDPSLQYKRAAWLNEHNHQLWSARPRFIVQFAWAVDDGNLILSHGYHRGGQVGGIVWYERN